MLGDHEQFLRCAEAVDPSVVGDVQIIEIGFEGGVNLGALEKLLRSILPKGERLEKWEWSEV
jgi:hypothetical protein